MKKNIRMPQGSINLLKGESCLQIKEPSPPQEIHSDIHSDDCGSLDSFQAAISPPKKYFKVKEPKEPEPPKPPRKPLNAILNYQTTPDFMQIIQHLLKVKLSSDTYVGYYVMIRYRPSFVITDLVLNFVERLEYDMVYDRHFKLE